MYHQSSRRKKKHFSILLQNKNVFFFFFLNGWAVSSTCCGTAGSKRGNENAGIDNQDMATQANTVPLSRSVLWRSPDSK